MQPTTVRRHRRLCFDSVGPVLGLLLSSAAISQNTGEPAPQQPSLAERIEALEREVQNLRQRDSTAQPGRAAELPAAAKTWPDVHLTGFFHLDAGYYLQDSASKAVLGDISDTLNFRRLRIAAAGKVAEDVSFIAEFDEANAQPRFVDVWMQLDRTPLGQLRIGRFRQPFGMDELTSARELAFFERNLGFALAPFRQTGVQLADTAFGQRMTYALSGYRYNSDPLGNVFTDSGGYGLSARVTGLLLEDGDHVAHLGAAYSHNDPGQATVRFAYQNEFFGGATNVTPGTVPFFVDTGALAIAHTDLFNVEAAFGTGPVAVQAEARLARVEQSGSPQTFHSAYAQVRWMLTGETIPYVHSGGVFGRVQPARNVFDGGIGAFELAGRISQIDLDDTASGRRLVAATLGLNWYLNQRTKLQLCWVHDELSDRTFGDSDSDTFGLRAQIDF